MRQSTCALLALLALPLGACGTHDSLDLGGATESSPTPASSPGTTPDPSPSPSPTSTPGTSGNPVVETEPNNTLSQANSLGTGGTFTSDFTGSCGKTDPRDWYKFDSSSGQVNLSLTPHWTTKGTAILVVTVHLGLTTSGGLSMAFGPGDEVTSTLSVLGGGDALAIEVNCPTDGTVTYSATLQSQ